ncbi:hypothetical protein K440DRAFT_622043 [Wilcoxina mikolae CBS 423.85]|nr:hypothetical protein K440DRAFT_622043 [Wilcoxina mikolae CBS 423.85]
MGTDTDNVQSCIHTGSKTYSKSLSSFGFRRPYLTRALRVKSRSLRGEEVVHYGGGNCTMVVVKNKPPSADLLFHDV